MTTLSKVQLFTGGPAVSQLCLGTMMFALQTDESEARKIFDCFCDAGGNFIDTADVYSDGGSEEMLGRLVGKRRDDFFVATKVGNVVKGVEGAGGLSADWIARAAEMSLKRLGMETIDLYYLTAGIGALFGTVV